MQPKLAATAQAWRPQTAPAVYYPQRAAPPVSSAAALSPDALAPASALRPAASPAPSTGAVQCVILKGKTYRSQPIGTLKNTTWYKALPDDTHKAFALLLHADDDEDFTKVDALAEIQKRIARAMPRSNCQRRQGITKGPAQRQEAAGNASSKTPPDHPPTNS